MMLKLHGDVPERRHVEAARATLAREGVALVPTETGYCFVGDPKSEKVFKRFLDLRQAHPKNKPFSVLCHSISQLSDFAFFNTPAFRFVKKAFPGPVTVILTAAKGVPKYAGSSKKDEIGVRVSGHPAASQLAEAFGEPLLITSVTDTEELQEEHYYDDELQNEAAWWTRAEAVANHFKNKIDVCFCAPEPIRLRSSTIVDFTGVGPVLVRDGGWPLDDLGIATYE